MSQGGQASVQGVGLPLATAHTLKLGGKNSCLGQSQGLGQSPQPQACYVILWMVMRALSV